MVEIQKGTSLYVGMILIILSVGTTYILEETGKYKTCPGGWELRDDGKYDCNSRNIEPQWCFKGSEEGVNIGYRCYLGNVIKIEYGEEKQPYGANEVIVHANNKKWICSTDNGEVTSYSKCRSGKYEGYLGELI